MSRAQTFMRSVSASISTWTTVAATPFRVVQMTRPDCSCSITIMSPPSGASRSLHGVHVVVSDIEAAHAELAGRGVDVSDSFCFEPTGPVAGLALGHADDGSFFSFSVPDGISWLVQAVALRGELATCP